MGAVSAKQGAIFAKKESIEGLELARQQRHAGIPKAAPRHVRKEPLSACIAPAGCVCKGATRKMYKKFEAAIKVAGKDVISGSRGVFRLEVVGDSAEQVQDRVGEAPPPRWFHLAYVCLKPWRATLVELDRVNAMAERALEDALPDPVFVRPLLEENKPRVLPLQVLVNELVLDWGYDIVHHSLSDSQTPMPVLRGHARVLPGEKVTVWRGEAVEMSVRNKTGQMPEAKRKSSQPVRQGVAHPASDLPEIHRVGEPLSDADEVASCDVSAASQSDSEDQLQTLLDAATANAPISTSGDPEQSSQASSDSEASGGEKAAPEEESQALVTRNVQEETIRDWYGFRLTWVPPKKAAQGRSMAGDLPVPSQGWHWHPVQEDDQCEKSMGASHGCGGSSVTYEELVRGGGQL